MAFFNFRKRKTSARSHYVETAPHHTSTDVADLNEPISVVESETVNLVEERLDVDTVFTPGDTLRVSTKTDIVSEDVELNLRKERYDVVRISVDQVVDAVPDIRRENGVTIIPVMEERAVVVKQLVLVEELHIREDHSVELYCETVELRRQRAVVDRENASVI